MKRASQKISLAAVSLLLLAPNHASAYGGPYQATGFKIGEVTDTSAIIWTRLTLRTNRNPSDGPMVEIIYANNKTSRSRENQKVGAVRYPSGMTVSEIRGAVPGTTGQTRVSYRLSDATKWTSTPWNYVDPRRDFTNQIALTKLSPKSRYSLRVETRKGTFGSAGQALEGGFHTAPRTDDPARVVFTVSTGQAYPHRDREDGFNIYPEMLKLDPSFFVHTGDVVYYDGLAKTQALARYHWQRTYSLPTNVNFHRQVASYFMKDDHDLWRNDCWPTMQTKYMHRFTFKQGLAVFAEQVPTGKTPNRTRRWGKDLQIWMVEGREFRSPSTDPDGPRKTIWGEEQKEWFKRTVRESDATFRILITPTPLVGPDRRVRQDNHSNAVFKHEGDELRQFISEQKNLVVVTGDRHWQYMSIHPKTKVREYSGGPASDKHAGGWRKGDYRSEYHKYLNVIGGFLSVTVERVESVPTLTFRFHDSKGAVKYTDRLERMISYSLRSQAFQSP